VNGRVAACSGEWAQHFQMLLVLEKKLLPANLLDSTESEKWENTYREAGKYHTINIVQ